MSDHSFGSDYTRAQRIRELERAADAQRPLLAARAHVLAQSFSGPNALRAVAGALSPAALGGLVGARGWVGPVAGFLWRHFAPKARRSAAPAAEADAPAEAPARRKAPWMALAAAGAGLARVGWWIAKRRR